MFKNLREPVNSLTHWAGAILALGGLIALLIVGWGAVQRCSLVIYGVSLIFLFSASATYHMVCVKDKALEIFRKIDHAAIYFLIAGTYTPICVNAFTEFWQWGMLSIIWSLAVIGIIVKVFYIPRAALVERRDLSHNGLVVPCRDRTDVWGTARMGHWLPRCRWCDLYAWRGGVYDKGIHLCSCCIWFS